MQRIKDTFAAINWPTVAVCVLLGLGFVGYDHWRTPAPPGPAPVVPTLETPILPVADVAAQAGVPVQVPVKWLGTLHAGEASGLSVWQDEVSVWVTPANDGDYLLPLRVKTSAGWFKGHVH